MELKSETMKTAFKNANIFLKTKEIEKLKIIGNEREEDIQELQGEELQNFIKDLRAINQEIKIQELNIQNLKAKGEDIESELRNLIQTVHKIQINNCEILNMKQILEYISEKEIPAHEELLKHDKIKAFAYDKQNKILGLSVEQIEALTVCEKYLNVNSVGILISSEAEKKLIKQNIKNIQNSQISTKKIIDISKEQNISEQNMYEIYINGMIVLIQSPLIIDTIGLNRIPVIPKENNINGYMIAIDGKHQNTQGKYQIPEDEQELLLNELNEIAEKVNINMFVLKNVEFTPNQKIVPTFEKVLSNVSKIEMENVTVPNLKQILNELQNENIEAAKIINCGINITDLNNLQLQNFVIGNTSETANKTKSEVNWIQKIKEFLTKIPILNHYFNNKLMLPEGKNTKIRENNKFTNSLKSNVIIPKEIKEDKIIKEQDEITK